MTTTEHLEKIKAKCLANLAIAERRTTGKWEMAEDNEIRTAGGASFVADCYDVGGNDSVFIAACAGAAEAGWRSTIAAIDTLTFCYPDGNIAARSIHAYFMAETIIAAWPEEIL